MEFLELSFPFLTQAPRKAMKNKYNILKSYEFYFTEENGIVSLTSSYISTDLELSRILWSNSGGIFRQRVHTTLLWAFKSVSQYGTHSMSQTVSQTVNQTVYQTECQTVS